MSEQKSRSCDHDLTATSLLELVRKDIALLKQVCNNMDECGENNLTTRNPRPRLFKRGKRFRKSLRRRNRRTTETIEDQMPLCSLNDSKCSLDISYLNPAQHHQHTFSMPSKTYTDDPEDQIPSCSLNNSKVISDIVYSSPVQHDQYMFSMLPNTNKDNLCGRVKQARWSHFENKDSKDGSNMLLPTKQKDSKRIWKNSPQLEKETNNTLPNNYFSRDDMQSKSRVSQRRQGGRNFNINKELAKDDNNCIETTVNTTSERNAATEMMYKASFKDMLLRPRVNIGFNNLTDYTRMQNQQYPNASHMSSRGRCMSHKRFAESGFPSKKRVASGSGSRASHLKCGTDNHNHHGDYINSNKSYNLSRRFKKSTSRLKRTSSDRLTRCRRKCSRLSIATVTSLEKVKKRNNKVERHHYHADYRERDANEETMQVRQRKPVKIFNDKMSLTCACSSHKCMSGNHAIGYMSPLRDHQEVRTDRNCEYLELSKNRFLVNMSFQSDRNENTVPRQHTQGEGLCEMCHSIGKCHCDERSFDKGKPSHHLLGNTPALSSSRDRKRINKHVKAADSVESRKIISSNEKLKKNVLNYYQETAELANVCPCNVRHDNVCACDVRRVATPNSRDANNCALFQIRKLLGQSTKCELCNGGLNTHYIKDHGLTNSSQCKECSMLPRGEGLVSNTDKCLIIPNHFVSNKSMNDTMHVWKSSVRSGVSTDNFKTQPELSHGFNKLQKNSEAFVRRTTYKNRNKRYFQDPSILRKSPKMCSAHLCATELSASKSLQDYIDNKSGHICKCESGKEIVAEVSKSESVLPMKHTCTGKDFLAGRLACQDYSHTNSIFLISNRSVEDPSELEASSETVAISACDCPPMTSGNYICNREPSLHKDKVSSSANYKPNNINVIYQCPAKYEHMTYDITHDSCHNINSNAHDDVCDDSKVTQTRLCAGTLTSLCYISEPIKSPVFSCKHWTQFRPDSKKSYRNYVVNKTDEFGYSNNCFGRSSEHTVSLTSTEVEDDFVALASNEVEDDLELELRSLVDEYSRARQDIITNRREDSVCSHGLSENWFEHNLSVNNPNRKHVNHVRGFNKDTCRNSQWRKARHLQHLKHRNIPEPVRVCSRHNMEMFPAFCDYSRSLNVVSGSKGNQNAEFVPFKTEKPPEVVEDKQLTNKWIFPPASTTLTYRDSREDEFPQYGKGLHDNYTLGDNDIPFCPTTENYWQTAADEPGLNLQQQENHPNDTCSNLYNKSKWSSSLQSDSGTLNGSSRRISLAEHPIQESVHNGENHTENGRSESRFPEMYNHLNKMWKRSEQKINKQLRSINETVNSRLNCIQSLVESKLVGACGTSEGNMRSCRHMGGRMACMNRRETGGHVGTIHLSTKQKQARNGVYGLPLNISAYKRKRTHLEAESDDCNEEAQNISKQSSETMLKIFPTIKFNEITQKSQINLNCYNPHNGSVVCCHRNESSPVDYDIRSAQDDSGSYKRACKRMRYTDETNVHVHSIFSEANNRRNAKDLEFTARNDRKNVTDLDNITRNMRNKPSLPRYKTVKQVSNESVNPGHNVFTNNRRSEISRFQRHNHSRSCRRRCVTNGTICCNKCLPSPPVGLDILTKVGKQQHKSFLKRKEQKSRNFKPRYRRSKRKPSTKKRSSKTSPRKRNGKRTNFRGRRRYK